MIHGKKSLALIKSICSKLPKINLPTEKNEYDYPNLEYTVLEMVGMDYHIDREVFTLGKHAFFRRYNGDWSGTVLYGNKSFQKYVSWQASVNQSFLAKLNTLIDEKDQMNITLEDIAKLLNFN